MDNIKFDFNSMIEQAVDINLINIISDLSPTIEDGVVIKKALSVMYKYGVKPTDAINLFLELAQIFNEGDYHDE